MVGGDCGFNSFCDYTPNAWDDDEALEECADAFSDCDDDQECSQCIVSAESDDDDSDDDVFETCGFPSDNSCGSWAEFYCCAARTDMERGCEDNSELAAIFSELPAAELPRVFNRGCHNREPLAENTYLVSSYTPALRLIETLRY